MAIDHYENFPVASVLLPRRLVPAVEAIYAFARSADDLADEGDATPAERLAAWQGDREAYASVHGEGAWAAQELFYRVIDGLYRKGSLGGVRLTARRL